MQSQVVCNGCRTILLYPRGALNVRCAVCNTVNPIQPSGTEMDQIICGCCHTLLMYTRGASSVRCLCCHTVNLTNVNPSPAPGTKAPPQKLEAQNQVATVRCGGCQMTLMYPYGAPSVKCAVCHFITNVGPTPTSRVPNLLPQGVSSSPNSASSSASTANSQGQTVVVENPMSFDGSGKLVSNVVVGVTTDKK